MEALCCFVYGIVCLVLTFLYIVTWTFYSIPENKKEGRKQEDIKMDERKIKTRLTVKCISLKALLETLFFVVFKLFSPSKVSHWTIKEAKTTPVAYLSACPEDEPFKFMFSFLGSGLPWVSGAVPHSCCALCIVSAAPAEAHQPGMAWHRQGTHLNRNGVVFHTSSSELSTSGLPSPWTLLDTAAWSRDLWHPSQPELIWDSDV